MEATESCKVLKEALVVKISKVYEDAIIPTKAHKSDAGYDMYVHSSYINGDIISYGLGVKMEIPFGYVGLIFPRSSVFTQDLMLSNCVGVIDSGYRGEIQAKFRVTKDDYKNIYKPGDRCCQIIIMPFPYVVLKEVPEAELTLSDRGENGYGSSGK